MRVNSTYLALGAIIAGIGAWAATHASPSEQLDAPAVAAGCARQFERAQRVDMESFRDYDAETFRAGHHPDTTTVFASGAARYGIDAVMEALRSHFENREAVWAWTERYRVVDGCKTAFILYETTYDIPSNGFHQRALTGVAYTYHRGKWLAIADTGTLLP